MRKLVIIIIALFLIITCACAQQAATIPVAGEIRHLSEMTSVPAEKAWTHPPQTLYESVPTDYDNVSISIATQIEVPTIEHYPIVELKRSNLSNAVAKAIFDYFAQDYILYNGRYTYTISEIESSIAKYQSSSCTDPNADEYINQLSDDLKTAYHESEWPTYAGERSVKNNTAFFYKRDAGNYMQVVAHAGEIDVYIHQISGAIHDEFGVAQGDSLDGEPAGTKLNPAISYVDALRITNEFFNDCGISNMELANATKARQLGYSSIGEFGKMSEGWLLTFAPSYYGLTSSILVPTEYQNYSNINYSSYWTPEYMNIYVDKFGISYLIWKGHSKEIDLKNSNVQLLDFGIIHQRIIEQLLLIASGYENDTADWSICVDRILLGGVPLATDEHTTSVFFQPAWYVEYHTTNSDIDFKFRSSFMISAISSEIVEPRKF